MLNGRERTPARTSSTRPASTPPGSAGSAPGSSSAGGASHRAHFSWHAALHELAWGDVAAVRVRYAQQLAPPAVLGMRALVDSASLLWRCHVRGAWQSPDREVREVLDAVEVDLLERPQTAFTAMHAALGHRRGRRRRTQAAGAPGREPGLVPARRRGAAVRWACRCDRVALVRRRREPAVAGVVAAPGRSSLAQREVVEDTLLCALVMEGRLTPPGRCSAYAWTADLRRAPTAGTRLCPRSARPSRNRHSTAATGRSAC